MAAQVVTIQEFEKQASEITQDKPAENLSKEEVDRLCDLIEGYVDDAYEAEGLPVGGADVVEGKIAGVGRSFASFSTAPAQLKNKLIWATVKKLFGSGVAETEAQWKLSTPVHLKLDQLQEMLDKYNLGMGSVLLYHCDGNDDRAIISYVINGLTKSRFSHATVMMPHPDYVGLPVLWQSAHPCECKLGGGSTRSGPDLADLKVMIKEYYKGWPSSRFVFRPIKTALSAEQQKSALDFVKATMADENMTFPSISKLYWTWILSRHPHLASLAYLCGFDEGVEEDKYTSMFCSQLVTGTLLSAGVLNVPIKAGQFSPGEYGLPYDKVGQTPDQKTYGEEFEFIFDDLITH